jgi:hypothetical protein
MDLFRAEYGFVNSDLASIYKVSAPARDFDRVDFPRDQERAGSWGGNIPHADEQTRRHRANVARPIHPRTVSVPTGASAPQGVDTNLPPVSEFRPVTNRERLKEHATNPSCASCHSLIDPLGFGLEKFDAIGVRREKAKLLFYPDVHEAKIPKKTVELDLDISGKIAGLENSEFTNSREMGEILASSAQCQECVVRQVFRYMAGRRDTPEDAPLIRAVLDDFRRSGFQFQQLLVSLVKAGRSAQKGPVGKESRWQHDHETPAFPAAISQGPVRGAIDRRGRTAAASVDVQLAWDRLRGVCLSRKRFVLWFNGNGIPERYWIPTTLARTTT